jgi:hypothetical protein
LLEFDPGKFAGPFASGVSILSQPSFPHSGISFFTELLVKPHAIARIHLDTPEVDLGLDVEHASRLRDNLLSLLFASDPSETGKTYVFLSYLLNVSAQFLSALSATSSQSIAIIASTVINRVSPITTGAGLSILAILVGVNSGAFEYILPLGPFINALVAILKEIPKDIQTMSLYAAATYFCSASFSMLVQAPEFQRSA